MCLSRNMCHALLPHVFLAMVSLGPNSCLMCQPLQMRESRLPLCIALEAADPPLPNPGEAQGTHSIKLRVPKISLKFLSYLGVCSEKEPFPRFLWAPFLPTTRQQFLNRIIHFFLSIPLVDCFRLSFWFESHWHAFRVLAFGLWICYCWYWQWQLRASQSFVIQKPSSFT